MTEREEELKTVILTAIRALKVNDGALTIVSETTGADVEMGHRYNAMVIAELKAVLSK